MALAFAKQVAVDYLNGELSEIKDCVLTVPDFYTTKERQALLDAATLAGLNVLTLINENTAVALNYGIEKNYELGKSETLIFYNMGTTSTKVTVARYSSWLRMVSRKVNKTVGQVEVLSQAWDESLGGSSFDLSITNLLKERAEKEFGREFGENYRVMARLRKEAERVKKVLSANKEARIRITSLVDDEDFSTHLTSDIFLTAANSLLKRAMKPLELALSRSGLAKDDIEGIVLMGGGSRIPRNKEKLTDFLDQELRKDLNTDEAAALGAVFRAANMSTTFRVRQIGMIDRALYSVGASFLNFKEWEQTQSGSLTASDLTFYKRALIFPENSILKRRKSVSFNYTDDLFVSLYYANAEQLPAGTTAPIQIYRVSGVPEAIAKFKGKDLAADKPKIVISFAYDASGIVSLLRAGATFSVNVGGKVEKEKVALTVEALGVDVKTLTEKEKLKSVAVLKKYDAIDKDIRETAHAYNELESFIFENRKPLQNEDEHLWKVSSEDEREKVSKMLEETEDWLYEVEQSKTLFVERLQSLKEQVDPMMTRASELKIRKSSISSIRDECSGLKSSLEDLKVTKTWIPEEDIDAIVTKIEDWEGWLKSRNKEQKKRDLQLEPLFLIEDLEKRVQEFGEEVRKISKRQEPQRQEKKEKRKKTKKKKEEEKDEDQGEESEGTD